MIPNFNVSLWCLYWNGLWIHPVWYQSATSQTGENTAQENHGAHRLCSETCRRHLTAWNPRQYLLWSWSPSVHPWLIQVIWEIQSWSDGQLTSAASCWRRDPRTGPFVQGTQVLPLGCLSSYPSYVWAWCNFFSVELGIMGYWQGQPRCAGNSQVNFDKDRWATALNNT